VAKLVAKELVTRQGNPADRRMREAVIAPKGKAMTDRLDAARARIAAGIFATWQPQDVKDLVRLMAKFSAALEATEQ
ncbi:MAG TPA: MarR family transcriptional regulator, partial [Stenotrophomonas sp.]|nr:MarR family transcriptional regulator [Stenotrophomonas sp.]